MRRPGLWLVNLSVIKSVGLGGGSRLELRADALNAVNHVNPVATPIVTDVRNAAFGRIRQVSDARVVQIGARVTF